MVSPAAQALGLGRPQTLSALGQPLNLLFPLQLAAGESVALECIRAQVQVGDTQLPTPMLHWMLEGDGERPRAVRLRSAQPVDEPFVSVELSLGCPSRLTRQFTAFIDPPGHASPDPVAETPQAMPGYSPVLQAALNTADAKPAQLLAPGARLPATLPSPLPAAARPPLVAQAEPAASAASAGPTVRRPSEPGRQRSLAARSTAAPAVKAASAPRAAAPRLSLEPAEALLGAQLAVEAAASAASAVQQSQEKLQAMERRMGEMQREQQRSQAALEALRQELQAARAQQGQGLSSAWVLGLGLLSLALATTSLLLWRHARARRQEARWWHEQAQANTGAAPAMTGVAARPVAPPAPAVTTAPMPLAAALSAVADAAPADAPAPTMPMPLTLGYPPEHTMELPGLDQTWPSKPVQAEALEPVSVQLVETGEVALSPAAPVTVEDLIDLEQQVEFFLVLGQDDAAIELLSERLDHREVASGLPFLKLMELYQRRGEREAFERVAQRFGRQFGVRAPAWSEDMNQGAGLEEHAELLARLQSSWADAGASMAQLQELLAHTGPDQGGLALPAYRELLMLYAVARDRSEHEVRGEEIDVFLPLEATSGTDMMATMVWQAPPGAAGGAAAAVAQSVDLDLSLEEIAPKPAAGG